MDEKLTPKSELVVSTLRAADEPVVGLDLGEQLGMKGIYGILTSLIKKGLVEIVDTVERIVPNAKGENVVREYKRYALTDKGLGY